MGAFDVAVTDNGDIYVTGNPRRMYWKNGEKISFSSDLYAVETDGNDVYLLGEKSYWKNNVQVMLPENGKDIVVFKGKVYVLFEDSYWSSETGKMSLVSSNDIKAHYINVDENGDVYITGYEGKYTDYDGYYHSFTIFNMSVWMNGQIIYIIPISNNGYGIINDIFFTGASSSDGNLYVVGTVKGPNLSTPGYWINGERIDFYAPREYYPGNANSIWIDSNN